MAMPATTQKITKKNTDNKLSKDKKEGTQKSKSVARFFGIDKNEADGLHLQKLVRNEWQ